MVLFALCNVDMDDIYDVRQVLNDFNMKQWRVLGEHLGLGENLLDLISADHKGDGVRECFNEVLKAWLRWNYDLAKFGRPTWHRLADAVERSGDPAFATKICPKH